MSVFLDRLKASIQGDNHLTVAEFNQARSEANPAQASLTGDINQLLKETLQQPKCFFESNVFALLKDAPGLDAANVEAMNRRSRAAEWALNALRSKVGDSALSRVEWNEFLVTGQGQDETGLFAGVAYALGEFAQKNIQIDEAVKTLAKQRWNAQGQLNPVLNVIAKYFPNLLGRESQDGDNGCANVLAYNFNHDKSCNFQNEVRQDYDHNGLIDDKDDWTLLALNIGNLGPHEGEIKATAIAYWSNSSDPDAARHLAYWKGERKLQMNNAVSFWTGTDWSHEKGKEVLYTAYNQSYEAYSLEIWDGPRLIKKQSGGYLKARVSEAERNGITVSLDCTRVGEKKYQLRFQGVRKEGNVDQVTYLSYEARVWSPINPEKVNVDPVDGSLSFSHNQEIPVKRVEVFFYRDFKSQRREKETGLMHRQDFPLTPSEGRGPQVTLRWPKDKVPQNTVKEAKVVFYDPHDPGYTSTYWIPLVPIELEHQQINFAVDSTQLTVTEANLKLVPVIQKIWLYQDTYPKQDFTLYIVGKASTAGDDVHNLELSQGRARVIAEHFDRYLSRDGRKIRVKYVGVGEKMTLTADGVEDPKYRVVDYWLSEKPPFNLPSGMTWAEVGKRGEDTNPVKKPEFLDW